MRKDGENGNAVASDGRGLDVKMVNTLGAIGMCARKSGKTGVSPDMIKMVKWEMLQGDKAVRRGNVKTGSGANMKISVMRRGPWRGRVVKYKKHVLGG